MKIRNYFLHLSAKDVEKSYSLMKEAVLQSADMTVDTSVSNSTQQPGEQVVAVVDFVF